MDIYVYCFPGLYCLVPFVLKQLIRAQVHEPVLRHQIVQLSGTAKSVTRQMSCMVVQLFPRRVSYIRQTPGNGSSFFS